jgi:hypothetical protein
VRNRSGQTSSPSPHVPKAPSGWMAYEDLAHTTMLIEGTKCQVNHRIYSGRFAMVFQRSSSIRSRRIYRPHAETKRLTMIDALSHAARKPVRFSLGHLNLRSTMRFGSFLSGSFLAPFEAVWSRPSALWLSELFSDPGASVSTRTPWSSDFSSPTSGDQAVRRAHRTLPERVGWPLPE